MKIKILLYRFISSSLSVPAHTLPIDQTGDNNRTPGNNPRIVNEKKNAMRDTETVGAQPIQADFTAKIHDLQRIKQAEGSSVTSG